MRDWNHDGKNDNKDLAMDYYIFEEINKEDGNSYYSGARHCSGGVFKGTIIVIIVILILALVLGVTVPGAVWRFFAKVLLVIGFFKVLKRNVKM